VAIADFTNDGIGDIAVTNQGVSTLGVYVGLGFGTYSPQLELSTPTGPQAVIRRALTPPDYLTQRSRHIPAPVTSSACSRSFDIFEHRQRVQVPYPARIHRPRTEDKSTPYVHGGNEVTLQMEFEIRSLAGSALNGIPVINNQTLNQTIR